MKKLVTYFSASGITKKVAEKVANELGSDLFEIEPVQKYTHADLNYMDKNSRTTIEMKDKTSRPKVAKVVPNMQDYETVVIGFPVRYNERQSWTKNNDQMVSSLVKKEAMTKEEKRSSKDASRSLKSGPRIDSSL